MQTQQMSFGSNAPLINRPYHETPKYQWVREVVVNSIQNGATEIHLTKEWQAAGRTDPRGVPTPIHRRMIVDNGTGIPGDRMMAFLNKYGGSGKTIGEKSENFGLGSKTSLLPWNHYGVVAISRYEGKQFLVWLHFNPTSGGTDDLGTYGARIFVTEEDNFGPVETTTVVALDDYETFYVDDDGVDWTKVFPGTDDGFCLVLLGNSPSEDTIDGDVARGEGGKYSLVRYLNSRFWDFPQNVRISVDQEETYDDPSTWAQTPEARKQVRSGRGLMENIEHVLTPTTKHPKRAEVASGELVMPGSVHFPRTRILWWLSSNESIWKESGERVDVSDYRVHFPMTAFMHQSHDGVNEVYDLEARRTDGGASSARARTKAFTGNNPVAERLAVIAIPDPEPNDETHIYPNSARARLLFSSPVEGGALVDWAPIVDFWMANRPSEVDQAISEHYQSLDSNSDDVVISDRERSALGANFKGFFEKMVAMMVPTNKSTGRMGAGGRPPGAPGTPKKKNSKTGEGKTGGSTRDRSQEKGKTNLAESNRRSSVVKVSLSDKDSEWPVSYDAQSRIATLYTEHTSVQQIIEFILERQISTKAIPEEMHGVAYEKTRERVLWQMQKHLTLAITEAVTVANVKGEHKETILSDVALSNCLRGVSHIEQMSIGSLGQALGGMSGSKKKESAA